MLRNEAKPKNRSKKSGSLFYTIIQRNKKRFKHYLGNLIHFEI
jgi:ribosomal protein L14